MLSGRGEETVGSSLSRIVLALVFVSQKNDRGIP